MQLKWSPEALADVLRLTEFVAEKNADAALHTTARLFDAADRLLSLPYVGRPSQHQDCRELIAGTYIIIYIVEEPVIRIIRIFHGREDWTHQEIP
jgi:toxin ParE1/3/4